MDAVRATLLACAALLQSCSSSETSAGSSSAGAATTSPPASATPTAAATTGDMAAPPSSGSAGTKNTGPMVTIPAGALVAGHACGAIPRITDEELAGSTVPLAEFSIDVYPYPNQKDQFPRTGVTRAEAEGFCKEAGKRLCSELEWERACKAGAGSPYPYGAAYDKNACAPPTSLLPGARAKCQSAFGMFDTHGLVFEWTSSPWGRGKTGLATVRGYKGAANPVRERCASGQGRDAMKGHEDVGFRCCSGPENPAIVDLPISHAPVLQEDAKPTADLIASLMRAMPVDHQRVPGASVTFDRVWRWHPRDNEEIVVASWAVKTQKNNAKAFELVVFDVCKNVATRVARLKGPVEKLEALAETKSKERLTARVSTKKDKGVVNVEYWYGAIALKEPAWIKEGNLPPSNEPEKPIKIPVLKRPPPILKPRK